MNYGKNKGLPTCDEINRFDIVDFLASIGFHPAKISGENFWYLSPLREEKNPSFKVNRRLNRWYDFGTSEGSTLIDFGIRYYHCTIRELLEKLSAPFLTRQIVPHKNGNLLTVAEPAIMIKNILPLHDKSLFHYLEQRRIAINVAQRFCSEIEFTIREKNFFAIGFKNNLGGHELRNKFFKGSSSPKEITLLKSDNKKILIVFEGFFDFLSYLMIMMNENSNGKNFLVLNSVSFGKKSLPLMGSYKSVELFLDNDAAGNQLTSLALDRSERFKDMRNLYAGYKDLNDFLCGLKMKTE